jgi:hypothetical protein
MTNSNAQPTPVQMLQALEHQFSSLAKTLNDREEAATTEELVRLNILTSQIVSVKLDILIVRLMGRATEAPSIIMPGAR